MRQNERNFFYSKDGGGGNGAERPLRQILSKCNIVPSFFATIA